MCTNVFAAVIVFQVNYMAVDMLRAQEAEKTSGAEPKVGAPGLGMVSSSAAVQGSAIDALERSAVQDALQRLGAGGMKRKAGADSGDDAGEGDDGPAGKIPRDADEIDI
jgi:hypothetical protein